MVKLTIYKYALTRIVAIHALRKNTIKSSKYCTYEQTYYCVTNSANNNVISILKGLVIIAIGFVGSIDSHMYLSCFSYVNQNQ